MGTTKDVREAVEKELSFDPMVDSRKITARNINGDVTLTGTVPSYPQYLAAAAATRRGRRRHRRAQPPGGGPAGQRLPR